MASKCFQVLEMEKEEKDSSSFAGLFMCIANSFLFSFEDSIFRHASTPLKLW